MRIVSLLPAATEIVALLGATDHLVGITHECDYPDIVGSRARVTKSAIPNTHDPAAIDAAVRTQNEEGLALFALDETRIRALHPDVLLTQALCDVCAVRESDVRALATRITPQPQVVTLGGTSLEGIYDDVRNVGTALGVADEVEELLAGLHDRVKHVHDTLKAAQAPRPRVALVEWTSPVYLAGHWGPEQIKRAGGIDVLGTAGAHSVPVALDVLREADPEIVLFAPCGYSLQHAAAEARHCLAQPEWKWLAHRAVWALDANGLTSRPGPRVVDGIEAMARIFHPTLFSPVASTHAVRLQ
ncbi:MAG: ABC transporter substrate-binding protein [Gemmatimonadaceae bacterium]|nr:ABC transporter substrate-binding protein [Gemmatimonadaceae bacterium]